MVVRWHLARATFSFIFNNEILIQYHFNIFSLRADSPIIDNFRYIKIQHGSEAYRTQTKEIE